MRASTGVFVGCGVKVIVGVAGSCVLVGVTLGCMISVESISPGAGVGVKYTPQREGLALQAPNIKTSAVRGNIADFKI